MSTDTIPRLIPTEESGKGLRHITSHDVAKRAGVSQSAVSRCFTPGASVAPQTRAKVLRAASELNYRPNVHARNLITGRSSIIGVVVAHLDNLFYPRFLQLLTERLQARGLQVLLFVADGDQDAREARVAAHAARIRGNLDIYNAFNASNVINMNTTYGAQWKDAVQILSGRLLRIGAQFDF